MVDRLERFIRTISSKFEWLSILVAWTMTVLVFFDAASHKLLHRSLKGTWDFVSYLFIIATSFALSSSLINDKLIRFDLFIMKCPKRIKEPLACIVALLGMVLCALIIWQSLVYGHTLQVGAEVSSTARFPIYPFAYGIAISFFPMFLKYLSQFINSIRKVLKLPSKGV